MNFFTSSKSLGEWVKKQGSPDTAAKMIMHVVGEQNQQDIVDACRGIFEEKEVLSTK